MGERAGGEVVLRVQGAKLRTWFLQSTSNIEILTPNIE